MSLTLHKRPVACLQQDVPAFLAENRLFNGQNPIGNLWEVIQVAFLLSLRNLTGQDRAKHMPEASVFRLDVSLISSIGDLRVSSTVCMRHVCVVPLRAAGCAGLRLAASLHQRGPIVRFPSMARRRHNSHSVGAAGRSIHRRIVQMLQGQISATSPPSKSRKRRTAVHLL